MSTFNVMLKKVVDDSYDIETGYDLSDSLVADSKNGLVGKVKKFAVITDSIVETLYADGICEKLKKEGYTVNKFVFLAGEKSKTRQT